MFQEESSDELSLEVKANKRYAQILVKITDSSRSFEEAEKIIESLNIRVMEKSWPSRHWVLFKLDLKDMRNLALKLTEHGFVSKGINALPEERITSNKGR